MKFKLEIQIRGNVNDKILKNGKQKIGLEVSFVKDSREQSCGMSCMENAEMMWKKKRQEHEHK